MTEENDIDMTWDGNKDLSVAISFIKSPLWIEGEENFYTNCLLRELLQKCSGGKVIEMLKSILSSEERCALIKSEFVIKTETQLEENNTEFTSQMYLSQEDVKLETEYDVVFEWSPFSVRSRMIEMENVPFMAEKKRDKIDYMWRDVQRRANFYGFDAKVPAPYPLKEFDLANKVAILGKDQGWIKEYTILTYKKWFLEHLEPGSEPNLSSTLKEIGLDSDSLIIQAQTNEIEQKYLKNTEMAKNKGIFGSPTFIVENEVFWGDDRCEDAIKWLSK